MDKPVSQTNVVATSLRDSRQPGVGASTDRGENII